MVLRVPRCPLGGPGAEPRSRTGSSIPLVNFLTIVNSVGQFCRKESRIFAGSSIPLVNCRKAGSVLNETFFTIRPSVGKLCRKDNRIRTGSEPDRPCRCRIAERSSDSCFAPLSCQRCFRRRPESARGLPATIRRHFGSSVGKMGKQRS